MTYNKYIDSNNPKKTLANKYTLAEEIFNSISHGVGALLSIVALVILVAFASLQRDIWRIVSFSIYGFTLFFLYTSSTLYHSIFHEKSKKVLRILDHASIYLFIAGSYTPIILVSMRNTLGWIIFAFIWSLAIAGVVLKAISIDKIKHFSTALYVIMGWLIVIAGRPMLSTLPKGLFAWLLVGGLFYTFGILFYACKRIPFNHGIWHLFVLGGSTAHFFGILFYLAL